MNVLTPQTPEAWNAYVCSFAGWDIYYLCEYAVSLKLHGDGDPLLLCFEHGAERMCYVVMRKDIADDPAFTVCSRQAAFSIWKRLTAMAAH